LPNLTTYECEGPIATSLKLTPVQNWRNTMKPKKQVAPEPITDQEVESAIKVVGPHVLLAKQSFETLAQRQLSNRDHYLRLRPPPLPRP
jgi:hypothetical protein